MIKGTFRLGGDNQEVVIRGNELLFFDISSGMMSTIEGLNLPKGNCIKEFPDLEDDDEWKKKTILRLKEKMKQMRTETDKMDYVREELSKWGYEPMFAQRAGFRPKKFK